MTRPTTPDAPTQAPADDHDPQAADVSNRHPFLSVIIPAFNESGRLEPTLRAVTAFLSRQPFTWELIVTDDGSRDSTVELAQRFAAEWPQMRVLTSNRNRGKGAAVRRGVLEARGMYVLFSDADLSTPIEEIDRLLASLRAGDDVAIGSRALPTSTIVTPQPAHRRLMGTVFRRLTSTMAHHGVHDSQCGFKAFRTSAARHIFSLLETEGFAFDVEVILLARQLGYQVSEIGVTWANNRNSTVSPLRDPARMVRDIWHMRRGVQRRLLQVFPYTAQSRVPGIALVRLSAPEWQFGTGHLAGATAATGSARVSEARVHSATDGQTILSLTAVTGGRAHEIARRMAYAGAEEAGATGSGASISFTVRVLPLTSRVEEVADEAERLASGMGQTPRSVLGRLQARAAAREAERQALAGEEEMWYRRRRTVRVGILANLAGLVWWLIWLLDFRHASSIPLYSALVVAEAFSIAQVLGYWYTVWHERVRELRFDRVVGHVDVFIPTYNEPVSVVERTLRAALAMPYPHRTYLLDDGNRDEMGVLARSLGATWITRPDNRGAKAGNINHALSVTDGDFFVVFDADHAPHTDFLERMMPFMADPDVAFVQAPQYYANRDQNYIAGGAMDQQEIFFGPICRGKAGLDAVFCCGTNMVMRRAAVEEIGGMNETSIVEDAATSLELHSRGWKSRYVSERLADGLAPEDLGAYLSQQRRWARGNIELLFTGNLLRRNMPWRLRFQYLWSAMYYLIGLSSLVYLSLPVMFLMFGVQTVSAGAGDFIAHFLPYLFLTLFILARSAEGRLRFRAIQLSYSLFPVFLGALWSVLTGRRVGFAVTPKIGSKQSFYHLILPQLALIAISVVAIAVGFYHFSGARTVTNASWAAFNVIMLSAIVRAAAPQSVAAPDTAALPEGSGVEAAA